MGEVINTTNLYEKKNYSSAKNLQEWWFGRKPDVFGIDAPAAKNINLLMAHCAWFLSDYQFAVETYKQLLERYPELACEEIHQRIERFETEISVHEQRVFCDHDLLREILERLRYVYDGIDKPICVFVAENEEAYREFHQKAFPEHEIHPYSGFIACGFYWDANSYWLVFKAEYLDGSKSTEALTGLCAHEMAHLDLVAKGTHNRFLHHKEYEGSDLLIQERMTDLYVISKGLMYALYASREAFGSSMYVISPTEIHNFAKILQKIDRPAKTI